ncbi:MAG: sigma-54 dependent transcriptional regulator [Gemmatimonadaceae bacterium]
MSESATLPISTRSEIPPPDQDSGNSPAVGAGIPRSARALIRILVIDDDRTLREGCATVLQVEGYKVSVCGRGDEAIDMVKRTGFDILLVDLYMTPLPGIEILKQALVARPEIVVIMMTGNPSIVSNMEALRMGAWDYLPKPFSGTHLQLMIGRAAVGVLALREQNQARAEAIEMHGNSDKLALLGISPAFRKIVELARKVAITNASVMLVGESGTGKELIAEFLHRHSRRAGERLVPLNCAAVPEQLLESEMFGHRKGSFTGADRDKVGLLEMADGGTFFLDELTEMPMSVQAKLLRAVQDGVVRRVGSEQQDAAVDVRFISATNRDPVEAIRNRHLREDLYFRLCVFPIVLPPLRERIEDIPVLAQHFLAQFWQRHHPAGTPMPELGDSAMDFLQARPWRGNVRELQNVIEQLVVLATPGSHIDPDEIPMGQQWSSVGNSNSADIPVFDEAYHTAKEKVLARFEAQYVTQLVARASGNMSRAARMANVDRTTLYRLLDRQGLRSDSPDPPAS